MYCCFKNNEVPRSCNTTIYLLWLLRSEDVLEIKVHTGEHEKLWASQFAKTQGNQELRAVHCLGHLFGAWLTGKEEIHLFRTKGLCGNIR